MAGGSGSADGSGGSVPLRSVAPGTGAGSAGREGRRGKVAELDGGGALYVLLAKSLAVYGGAVWPYEAVCPYEGVVWAYGAAGVCPYEGAV